MNESRDFFPEYETVKKMSHPDHVLSQIREMKECYGIDYTVNFYEYGYLQDLDDLLVREFFSDQARGRFLGVGSGAAIDQTTSLLEKGWSGVYCDPDPLIWSDLLKNTEPYRDRTLLVNAAVATDSKLCDFHISESVALSSIKRDQVSNLYRTVLTHTVTMDQLLDRIGDDFDYVQFDIEGLDADVIESIDWSRRFLNCKLIGVEGELSIWQQLWEQGRFVISHVTEHNVYFKKIAQR